MRWLWGARLHRVSDRSDRVVGVSDLSSVFARHAFVDVETTGLDPAVDDVIEIGVVFVVNGRVLSRLERRFSARAPLPLAVSRLTGLKDADLRDQIAFREYEESLAQLLDGYTIVAHNASFEVGFLKRVLSRINAPVLDSCELLHYLHPEWPSHALAYLIKASAIGEVARHRALRDAEDTFDGLSAVLAKAVTEARIDDLAELLAELSKGKDAPQPLLALLKAVHALCLQERPDLTLSHPTPFLPPPPEQERQRPRTESGEQPAIDGGPPKSHEATVRAFETRTAPPGTFPAAERAVEAASARGERVILATSQAARRDALFQHILPELHARTGGGFSFSALRDQRQYMCRRRAALAIAAPCEPTHAEHGPRAYLLAFLRRSRDGVFDNLSEWFKQHFPQLTVLAAGTRSTPEATLGAQCPHYRRCFFHSAVAHAKAADVVLTSHALALSGTSAVRGAQLAIFDDASRLEESVTTLSSQVTSRAAATDWFERVTGEASLLRRPLAAPADLVAEAERACADARTALDELWLALSDLTRAHKVRGELWLEPVVRKGARFARVQHAGAKSKTALEEASHRLKRVADDDATPRDQRHDLADAAIEALALQAGLEAVVAPVDDAWCDAIYADDTNAWVRRDAVDVREKARRVLKKTARRVELVSGSFGTGATPRFALDRLGLDSAGCALVQPLEADAPPMRAVILLEGGPAATDAESPSFMAELVADLARARGGRVMALFDSSRHLGQAHALLASILEPLNIEVRRLHNKRGRAMPDGESSISLGLSRSVDAELRHLPFDAVVLETLPRTTDARPLFRARDRAAGDVGYTKPRAMLTARLLVDATFAAHPNAAALLVVDPGRAVDRAALVAALAGLDVTALPRDAAVARALTLPAPRPSAGGLIRVTAAHQAPSSPQKQAELFAREP